MTLVRLASAIAKAMTVLLWTAVVCRLSNQNNKPQSNQHAIPTVDDILDPEILLSPPSAQRKCIYTSAVRTTKKACKSSNNSNDRLYMSLLWPVISTSNPYRPEVGNALDLYIRYQLCCRHKHRDMCTPDYLASKRTPLLESMRSTFRYDLARAQHVPGAFVEMHTDNDLVSREVPSLYLRRFPCYVAPADEHDLRNSSRRSCSMLFSVAKPLTDSDQKKGYIYLFEGSTIDGTQFCKIGATTRSSVDDRLAEHESKQTRGGYTIKAEPAHTSKLVDNVYRVESLILAELRTRGIQQYDGTIGSGQSHDEWFVVKMVEAKKVVDYWTGWIRDYDPYGVNGLETEAVLHLCRSDINAPFLLNSAGQPWYRSPLLQAPVHGWPSCACDAGIKCLKEDPKTTTAMRRTSSSPPTTPVLSKQRPRAGGFRSVSGPAALPEQVKKTTRKRIPTSDLSPQSEASVKRTRKLPRSSRQVSALDIDSTCSVVSSPGSFSCSSQATDQMSSPWNESPSLSSRRASPELGSPPSRPSGRQGNTQRKP